jgi:hypothetical protein
MASFFGLLTSHGLAESPDKQSNPTSSSGGQEGALFAVFQARIRPLRDISSLTDFLHDMC